MIPGWFLVCLGLALRFQAPGFELRRWGSTFALWGVGLMAVLGPWGSMGWSFPLILTLVSLPLRNSEGS